MSSIERRCWDSLDDGWDGILALCNLICRAVVATCPGCEHLRPSRDDLTCPVPLPSAGQSVSPLTSLRHPPTADAASRPAREALETPEDPARPVSRRIRYAKHARHPAHPACTLPTRRRAPPSFPSRPPGGSGGAGRSSTVADRRTGAAVGEFRRTRWSGDFTSASARHSSASRRRGRQIEL